MHAPEFGRELWVERGGSLAFDDLLLIGRTQVEREERLAEQSNRYLFCDTSPLTTLFYCLDQFGKASPELEHLADRELRADRAMRAGFRVRSGWHASRARVSSEATFNGTCAELQRRGVPYIEVRGSVEARVEQVATELRRHK